MLNNRLLSSFPLFISLFFSFKSSFFFHIFCIHLVSFLVFWEFLRMIEFEKNINLRKRSQVKNNFFLTRQKLNLKNYSIIFTIQVIFLLNYINFIILSFLIFFLLIITVLYLKSLQIKSLLILIYLIIPFMFLINMRNLDNFYSIFSLLILIVISSDIGGFFFGKLIGGPKIFKITSPNKTYSGLFGGIFFSIISCSFFFNKSDFNLNFFFLIILLSLGSQFGDYLESRLKRSVCVKESSNLIPGHGGVLDRVDGALFLLNIFFFLNLINFELNKIFIV